MEHAKNDDAAAERDAINQAMFDNRMDILFHRNSLAFSAIFVINYAVLMWMWFRVEHIVAKHVDIVVRNFISVSLVTGFCSRVWKTRSWYLTMPQPLELEHAHEE